MKDFYQWLEESGLSIDLSILREEPPVAKSGKPKLQEKTARAGIAQWAYPPAYVRHQYPGPYFTPIAADAIQKMGSNPNS